MRRGKDSVGSWDVILLLKTAHIEYRIFPPSHLLMVACGKHKLIVD
jgi:hypothetical protein